MSTTQKSALKVLVMCYFRLPFIVPQIIRLVRCALEGIARWYNEGVEQTLADIDVPIHLINSDILKKHTTLASVATVLLTGPRPPTDTNFLP